MVEIWHATRSWKSRGFFENSLILALLRKKYEFFSGDPSKFLSFCPSQRSQYLKRQSFSDFSQIFWVSENEAEFLISEKKTKIEHQITKLLPHFPEREIKLWYKKSGIRNLEKVTITLLIDVRFQFSFQISKIQPSFLILRKFERNRKSFVASKIDNKSRIKKRE